MSHLQVLRYTVFGSGLFYGLYHQSKLGAAEKLAAVDREYARKQSLIEKARAEYTKKNLPPASETDGRFTGISLKQPRQPRAGTAGHSSEGDGTGSMEASFGLFLTLQ